jgi:hypothetical protein
MPANPGSVGSAPAWIMRSSLSLIFNLCVARAGSFVQVVRRVGGTWHGHRLILFGFLSQSSKTKAVAAMVSVTCPQTAGSDDTWLGGVISGGSGRSSTGR